MQEPVIAQVVVGVGDEHAERDPALTGTVIPARAARSIAVFSQAITFHVSELALGNLAIAARPSGARTCAFGRAPPSELPVRSSVRSCSSCASSRSKLSANATIRV